MNYVAGFLFSHDRSRVALISKLEPKWQAGFLNAIGGKIEAFDMTPKDAMIREFREETGLTVDRWEPFAVLENDEWNQNAFVVHFFVAFGDVDKVRTLTDEIVGVYALPLSPEFKLIPNLRWLIPLALDETTSFTQAEC